jgi:hypothetical protein
MVIPVNAGDVQGRNTRGVTKEQDYVFGLSSRCLAGQREKGEQPQAASHIIASRKVWILLSNTAPVVYAVYKGTICCSTDFRGISCSRRRD